MKRSKILINIGQSKDEATLLDYVTVNDKIDKSVNLSKAKKKYLATCLKKSLANKKTNEN